MKKITFLLLALLFLACQDSNTLFKEHQTIAMLRWEKTQARIFSVEVKDNKPVYSATLALRHSSKLEYGDISLSIKMISPSGKEKIANYIMPIRDRKTGNLIGSAMGDMCDTEMIFLEKITFEETGKYNFEVSHTMKEEIISILEVGLIVQKLP